jgi:hypothetical protein
MLHRNWHNPTRVTEENVSHSWSGWPDFSDPATRGCVLALVREAHGQPYATVHWCWEFDANHPTHVAERGLPRRMWDVDDITDWHETSATSEAEALVAALKAAP